MNLQKKCNAVITVKSRQELDGESDEMEIISEGNYYIQNGKYYIMYKEDISMGDVSSQIKVDGKTVIIKRKGTYNSEMIYNEDKNYSFVYRMPYGDMAMEIKTNKVKVLLGENGGKLELDYLLDAGGNMQKNTVSISVRKK